MDMWQRCIAFSKTKDEDNNPLSDETLISLLRKKMNCLKVQSTQSSPLRGTSRKEIIVPPFKELLKLYNIKTHKIIILGPQCSGKTTLKKYLQERFSSDHRLVVTEERLNATKILFPFYSLVSFKLYRNSRDLNGSEPPFSVTGNVVTIK